MHEKMYMDMDSDMPKERKHLFVSRNIVTSRKKLLGLGFLGYHSAFVL